MLKLHPNYIIDENAHKQSVVLPYKEWAEILDILEDYELGQIVKQRQPEKVNAIEVTLDEL
ncbi:MAG: antitoxin [Methylococcaceae bacterium]|nr:antitoxin [Methylococcaceae bacterium]